MMQNVAEKPMTLTEKTQGLFVKLHDKRWIKRFTVANSQSDRISLLNSYNIQTQEEEAVIQLLLDKLSPPKISITFESLVRAELEEVQKNGDVLTTREAEREWQEKIDAAILLDRAQQKHMVETHYLQVKKYLPNVSLEDFFPEAQTVGLPKKELPISPPMAAAAQETTNPSVSTKVYPDGLTFDSPLTDLKGLGVASLERLSAEGITMVGPYFELTADEATTILKTPIITAKHRDFFRKTITPNLI